MLAASSASLPPPAILRGGARGLEIVVINGTASIDNIVEAVAARIAEAPGFFSGNDVRIRCEDGPLPAGALARLDELAVRSQLRITEVVGPQPRSAVPQPVQLATGSGAEAQPASAPVALADHAVAEPVLAPVSVPVAAAPEPEPANDDPAAPRIVVGPIRSGVILEHAGHLIVFGDVNPGAEVRAAGNIVVLGRLRGTAHASIGSDGPGFILAHQLAPQQLRIGRALARAADSDTPGLVPEIAHLHDGAIVVERYLGRLPAGVSVIT